MHKKIIIGPSKCFFLGGGVLWVIIKEAYFVLDTYNIKKGPTFLKIGASFLGMFESKGSKMPKV